MTFSKNAFYFNKRKVYDFDIEKGIADTNIAYRFRTDYDGSDDAVPNMLEAFFNDPKIGEIDSFVIGMWGNESDADADVIINKILEHKDKLSHIKGVFFGDITYEENEASWIENTSHTRLLDALPSLEFFQVRGGNGLSLSELKHENLKKLVVQTGGLSAPFYKEISESVLPALEHLEIWLGSDYYGFDATPEQVRAAYTGNGANHFPALKYLGLRNSIIADALCEILKGDPILDRIEELDLSRGNLGDAGAQALVENPSIKNLKKLDLHHNYISDDWAEKLNNLGVKIDLKERDPNVQPDDRYISVSE
jgi:hypothetical protein